MIGISLRQLEVFTAIATEGSVRAAGERLHLSQPAVSMALAEMERLLDTELFDRERGRLFLNARGRDTLPLAQEVIERMAELQRSASSRSVGFDGELRLGASNTVGNYLVGDLLGGFIAKHPRVSIRLMVDNTDAIIKGVLDHTLDVGCIEGPVAHTDIDVHAWRDDVLAICTRPDHALAQRKRLKAEDFAGARWILREHGSGTRSLSERVLASLPRGEMVLELGQSEAIKQAVIAGLGIACLPMIAVADAVAAGRITALRTPFLDLRRGLSWILRRTRYRGALVGAFLDGVLDEALRPPLPGPRSSRNTRLSDAAGRTRFRHG